LAPGKLCALAPLVTALMTPLPLIKVNVFIKIKQKRTVCKKFVLGQLVD